MGEGGGGGNLPSPIGKAHGLSNSLLLPVYRTSRERIKFYGLQQKTHARIVPRRSRLAYCARMSSQKHAGTFINFVLLVIIIIIISSSSSSSSSSSHYFVVLLSSVLMMASIDGHLPFLAACHCSLLLLLKIIVLVLTWQINSLSLLSLSLSLSLSRWWRSIVVIPPVLAGKLSLN